MKPRKLRAPRLVGVAVPLLIAIATTLLVIPPTVDERGAADVPPPPGARKHPVAAASAPPAVPLRRPLPVARATAIHEWTEGDGTDFHVIQRIAHHPEEALRMIEENDRIHRRQLVYRNETADSTVQRARAKGQPLRRLTLPALDGRELTFEIARAELAPSGRSGTFAGRLAGRHNSQVTLAFKEGREAFTVISPDDGLYLQADPREPGELIVKAIDPATYVAGRCGNPDPSH